MNTPCISNTNVANIMDIQPHVWQQTYGAHNYEKCLSFQICTAMSAATKLAFQVLMVSAFTCFVG